MGLKFGLDRSSFKSCPNRYASATSHQAEKTQADAVGGKNTKR
jgi:hypothetical protein